MAHPILVPHQYGFPLSRLSGTLVGLSRDITNLKYIEKNSEGKIIYKIIYSAISGSQQKGWKH